MMGKRRLCAADKYADMADVFIFDIDGTLYPIFYMAINLIVLSIRHPSVGVNFYRARKVFRSADWPDEGCTSREVFLQRQAECVGKDVSYFENSIYRLINERVFRFRPYKGMRETLERLKSLGKRIYAYSDFPVGGKMSELGIEGVFDGEYSSEDAGFLKPDARGLIYLKEKIDFDVSRALFVGDRLLTDSAFARNCGMMFAQIGKDWKWR